MSLTLISFLVAILPSLIAFAGLALGDPKRLRVAQRAGARHRPALPRWQRQVLALVGLLPGLLLMLRGQWPAFLIWMGAVTAIGWALALWLAPSPIADR